MYTFLHFLYNTFPYFVVIYTIPVSYGLSFYVVCCPGDFYQMFFCLRKDPIKNPLVLSKLIFNPEAVSYLSRIWYDFLTNFMSLLRIFLSAATIDILVSIQYTYVLDLYMSYMYMQYFSYIMATSFSGGRSLSTRRVPPTMGKQLVNFITCDCESSSPFL